MEKIVGQKREMSQIFTPEGKVVPVTFVKVVAVPETLQVGLALRVSGRSKGRGFAGVMKRHNFKGGPKTHGQSDRQRHPGSIGQTTTPGRVYRGKRMAGRLGGDQVTIKRTRLVDINYQERILKVAGPLPGPQKGKLTLEFSPSKAEENQGTEA